MTNRTANWCDCERGHNGFGMAGRECDCQEDGVQQTTERDALLRRLDYLDHRYYAIGQEIVRLEDERDEVRNERQRVEEELQSARHRK